MGHIFFFMLFVLCITPSFAQTKIKSLTVTDEVIYATVDRPGELYVVTKQGQIQRFDINGKLLSVYKNNPAPTLFDPRDGARLFAYFRNDQHYSFLSPSFDVSSSYFIDSSYVIDPWLACISGDHNLWIIDAADGSIKKINVRTSSIEVDVRIPTDLMPEARSITSMREYQGFLFLLSSAQGILIFNGMGKWLKTVSSPGLAYFNFLGEELYYPDGDKIRFFNLFTAETREIPTPQHGRFTLITDERIFSVQNFSIDFFMPNR